MKSTLDLFCLELAKLVALPPRPTKGSQKHSGELTNQKSRHCPTCRRGGGPAPQTAFQLQTGYFTSAHFEDEWDDQGTREMFKAEIKTSGHAFCALFINWEIIQ